MATRCTVELEGENFAVYCHFDGGPSRMLPLLERFVERFRAGRGYWDEEYLKAQLVRFLIVESGAGPEDMLGFGITRPGVHGDLDYRYRIRRDWAIVRRPR